VLSPEDETEPNNKRYLYIEFNIVIHMANKITMSGNSKDMPLIWRGRGRGRTARFHPQ